jgi:hypothetical protein
MDFIPSHHTPMHTLQMHASPDKAIDTAGNEQIEGEQGQTELNKAQLQCLIDQILIVLLKNFKEGFEMDTKREIDHEIEKFLKNDAKKSLDHLAFDQLFLELNGKFKAAILSNPQLTDDLNQYISALPNSSSSSSRFSSDNDSSNASYQDLSDAFSKVLSQVLAKVEAMQTQLGNKTTS